MEAAAVLAWATRNYDGEVERHYIIVNALLVGQSYIVGMKKGALG
jgi:hypothetical protein